MMTRTQYIDTKAAYYRDHGMTPVRASMEAASDWRRLHTTRKVA